VSECIETVELSLEFDVHNLDALYEAAKEALEKLRSEAVAANGNDDSVLYAQPMEQLIKEHLHDPDGGELHLASCIMVILDQLALNIPGIELVGTTAGSVQETSRNS
jgi:hypothetical protein